MNDTSSTTKNASRLALVHDAAQPELREAPVPSAAQMASALMAELHFLKVCARIVFPLAPKSFTAKPGDVVIWDASARMATVLRGLRQCRVAHRFWTDPEDGGAAIVEMLEDCRLIPYDRQTGQRILAAISGGQPAATS